MNRSDNIKDLADAMSKFQGEVKNPKRTATNPFFKSLYTPLDVLIDTAKPALAKHGLSYLQSCSGDGANIIVTTLIMHSSGEWIELDPLTLKADKPTAQGAGSAITYARRYALAAALGLASEEDDDGNGAEGNSSKPKDKPQQTAKEDVKPLETKTNTDEQIITKAQITRLYAIVGGHKDIAKIKITEAGYESSKDIKQKDYDKICTAIEQEIKDFEKFKEGESKPQ